MPIIPGWEISPDRVGKVDKMYSMYDIGDPIITSKCKRGSGGGFLVCSDRGFAWRIRPGGWTHYSAMGNNMWIRWHDLFDVMEKKPGIILIRVKKRNMKSKVLILDKNGNYNFKKWKLEIVRNKNEPKEHYLSRKQSFNNIFMQIWEEHKTSEDPSHSDPNY